MLSAAKHSAMPHREALVRIAMLRLCEAFGDAIPQSGGLGGEFVRHLPCRAKMI